MLNVIKTRRSTRNFKKVPVSDEKLDTIIEAGRYAASGCNVQTAHFIVIKNRDVLDALRELVVREFAKMEIVDGMMDSIVHSINASKSGNYVFHYNAPTLIVVANSIDNPNALADTACAIDNMMLVANELDLGSCWINQLRWLNENSVIIEYLKSLGMRDGERVYGSLAVGYPNTTDGLPERTPLPRTGNEVTIIK